MFYNIDLLNKPKSRLGIVWLAATIGSRSSFKKLSRADVGSVDLVKICQELAAPDEAMALRLSSQLLYGTVRIYEQQLDSLHRAAEAMQIALKKSFLQPTTGSSGAQISGLRVADPQDLSLSKRSSTSVTLKPNEYCYVGEFFFDYAQELGRVLGKDPEEIYQERGFGSSASGSQRASTEEPGRFKHESAMERESNISSSQRSAPGRNTGFGPAYSAGYGESALDQDFGFDGFDLAGANIDLGLFDNLDAEVPLTMPHDDIEMAGRDKAVTDQLDMADLELGLFDSVKNRAGILANPSDAQFGGRHSRRRTGSKSGSDLSVGQGRDAGQHGSDSDLLNQRLGDFANDMALDFGPDEAGMDFLLPPLDLEGVKALETSHTDLKRRLDQLEADVPGTADGDKDNEDEEIPLEEEMPPTPKRPRLRSRKLPMDKKTQLTQEEMRSSRQDYVERQAAIRSTIDKAKRQKETDRWTAGMVGIKLFGPIIGPWSEMVTEALTKKDEEWSAFKKKAQAEYAKKRGTVYVQDAAESLASTIAAAASQSATLNMFHAAGTQLPVPGMLSEKARGKQRAISPRSPAAQSFRSTMMFDHQGQASRSHREGSFAFSDGRRGSVDMQFDFGAGPDDGGFMMFDSGSVGGFAPRSRQSSMGHAPIFNVSRQGSVARSIGRADADSRSSIGEARQHSGRLTPLPGFVPWSQTLDVNGVTQLDGFSQKLPPAYLLSPGMASIPRSIPRRSITPALARDATAGSAAMGRPGAAGEGESANTDVQGTQTTATESQVERDLKNFLKYATKLSTKKQKEKESLCLSDIAPMGLVDRTTACKAFYNTLALATSGKMQVKQDRPYGPIRMGPVPQS
ncbi:hypothetical protein CF327_g3547 [Tilletia walkeri]|nr:hypothetical protein CF327_g3547 [Tilletia walkeri]